MASWLRRCSWLMFVGVACQVPKTLVPATYDYQKEYDTRDVAVEEQIHKVYDQDSVVFADNQFPGARLNDFNRIDDSTFLALVSPENVPINPSPWYAFRLWANKPGVYYIRLDYGSFRHRYHPYISDDGREWGRLDSSMMVFDSGKFNAIKVNLSQDTLWIAAQPLEDCQSVKKWANQVSKNELITYHVVGKSKLGRDIIALKSNNTKASKAIVLLSRQHPPEVTGYFALQYFVDELLNHELTQQFFEEYQLYIYPLLNPDGVDEGNWRHNAGGVDLNRDWAQYHQPEIQAVVTDIVSAENPVILGVDFHSTFQDVFYTNDTLSNFSFVKEHCFEYMEQAIPGYQVNEKPSKIIRPVSKSWFFKAFGAEGITYEVGDNTPGEIIELKGRSAARGILEALIVAHK